MIGALSILSAIASVLSEETQEEADARILAEAKAYVAGLSDDEFEAWVVNMEKMGRFLEIAKIMRIEWLIERMQSLLPEAVSGMDLDVGKNKIRVEILKNSLFKKYYSLFSADDINVINKSILTLANDIIGWIAYLYARDIDNSPREDTRAAACMDAEWAYLYAVSIDRSSRDDTRTAACMSAKWAYVYAVNVDKTTRNDTRAAACMEAEWAYKYAKYEKYPRNDTRAAACMDAFWAYLYATHVDMAPHKDTRAAVSHDKNLAKRYAQAFGKKP